jgi:hypothetical protein
MMQPKMFKNVDMENGRLFRRRLTCSVIAEQVKRSGRSHNRRLQKGLQT